MDQPHTYDVIKEIGSGAQGSVYLLKEVHSQLHYAAKVVSNSICHCSL